MNNAEMPLHNPEIKRTRKKSLRKSKVLIASPLPWDLAKKSYRMLTDRQVIQLYLPGATRGALSMGRFGKGPYAALPFKKMNRQCRYVECQVVAYVEELAGVTDHA